MEQIDITDLNDDNGYTITIHALRIKTRDLISTLLNPRKFLRTDEGLPRDWQGLAELCGISGEKLPSIQEDRDPSNRVLELWFEINKNEATIGKLINNLEQLDRFDIIDDVKTLIEEDINFHRQYPNGLKPNALNLEADKDIITIDDAKNYSQGIGLQNYDAFVLFSEDDIDFTTELLETMEKQYDLKLCVKYRDLLGGGFEHKSVMKLISERCSRLIVILSPSFFGSNANTFFCSFAQAISIEQQQRKIIPCLYKKCDLPPELSCYFLLDYGRMGKLCNFWDKLHSSIVTPVRNSQDTSSSLVSRSMSEYNSQTHKKPVLVRENGNHLKPLDQSVRFNSLCNLTTAETEKVIPDAHMLAGTSANSLGIEPEIAKRKHSKSFYNKIRNKLKLKNLDIPKVKQNGQCQSDKDGIVELAAVEKVAKEKKKFWTLSRTSKRKVPLVN